MKLVSLDIQGFKSFAKRSHIAFGPGITGVVGPNGSGKSNIAEAIRWVLGEQSTKALRAKERTDVLYSGSLGNVGRAFVQLTFDNESGKFPVDAAEIAIARVLHKDGESRYMVNGEDVRLIDLQHMLAVSGVGTKSYAVISQGTVDQYLQATPAGRRELFDEATGIKPLKITLAAAEQKLARATTHADEIRAIVAELHPRVTFLSRQIDRYEKRDIWEQEFKNKQRTWYTSAWHALQHEMRSSQAALEDARRAIINARNARIAAEEANIQSLTSTSHVEPKLSWVAQSRTLLRASHTAITAIVRGEPQEQSRLQILATSIEALLKTEHTQKPRVLPQPNTHAEISTTLEIARSAEIAAERKEATCRIELEQTEREAAEMQQEIRRECGTAFFTEITTGPQEIENTAPSDPADLRKLAEKIASVGVRDEIVVREYEEATQREQHFQEQLNDIEYARRDIEQCITDVSSQIRETFNRQLKQITSNFQVFFTALFGGGEANIIQDEEGITVTVTPPRKRARHISLLSGGERSLTSIALLLAVLRAQQPPFIVLDEVDAALDEANSRRFAKLLQTQTQTTQSIVISHNRETMAAANALYGVTMHSDGVSTLYSVKIEDISAINLDVPTMAV